jgi:hypothetical protein
MWPFSERKKSVIALRKELLVLLPSAPTIIAEDRAYILPSDDEVLSRLDTDFSQYVAEYNDCDDYSYRAKGKAAGKAWAFGAVKIKRAADYHMLNCYVNDKKEFVLWEPQTRKTYDEAFEYIII